MSGKELSFPSALATREVASLFNVHPRTVRRWYAQGKIKACPRTPGGRLRFLKWDIADAYLNMSIQEYFRK